MQPAARAKRANRASSADKGKPMISMIADHPTTPVRGRRPRDEQTISPLNRNEDGVPCGEPAPNRIRVEIPSSRTLAADATVQQLVNELAQLRQETAAAFQLTTNEINTNRMKAHENSNNILTIRHKLDETENDVHGYGVDLQDFGGENRAVLQ